ncbi:phage major capsid protein [Desulfomicrobium escambiense]|uniref:phage major capsid protein n=1 Tax=Desulfomicrobium escambiense TaxID=29503 RepID=UPI0004023351|nr:phage major capsid protein [Desulfomicrobium escambiense]
MDLMTLRETLADKVTLARALQMKTDFGPEDQKAFDGLMNDARKIESRIQAVMRLDGLSDPQDALFVAGSAGEASISIVNQPRVYKDLGEQMLDVMAMTTGTDMRAKSAAAERYQQIVNAAGGNTSTPSEGGYLVETDKAADIATTAIQTGVFSSRCSIQPIGPNADSYSYLAADDRDRSDGKINGVQVYRKGEADLMSSSGKAKLKERELRLEDLYGLVYVTNRMLRDAPAMAAYTKRVLREQLAFKLDYEIFQGSGAGECLGITNSALPITVAKEGAQANDTIVAENVVKMMARFKGNIRNAAWFVNQDCLPQFPLMKVGDQPVFTPDFRGNPFGALFSLPIVPVEFCETLGDLGDIVLADWSQYLLIQKGGVEEAESIHVKFLTDETAFRFIMRNNGQPLHDKPITPLKGSNTLSPFVMLEAR